MNVFDIIGPVMIGPSSSHTAGAARIGKITRLLFRDEVKTAEIKLFGSFAKTYKGHGTDKALVGGILGMDPDNEHIRESLSLAKEQGVEVIITESSIEEDHPNTVQIKLIGTSGQELTIMGASVGGGNIRISKLNGLDVSITGQHDTIIVVHNDIPGVVGRVAEFLGNCDINLNNMTLARKTKGGIAVLSFEVDGKIDEEVTKFIERFTGVIQCTLLTVARR